MGYLEKRPRIHLGLCHRSCTDLSNEIIYLDLSSMEVDSIEDVGTTQVVIRERG